MNRGYYYDDEGYMFHSKYVDGMEVITAYGIDMRRRPWQKLIYKNTTTGEVKTAGEWDEEHTLRRGSGVNISTDWRYGLEIVKDSGEQLRQVFSQGE